MTPKSRSFMLDKISDSCKMPVGGEGAQGSRGGDSGTLSPAHKTSTVKVKTFQDLKWATPMSSGRPGRKSRAVNEEDQGVRNPSLEAPR